MQIGKALINDSLRVSKLSQTFHLPTIYNFPVILRVKFVIFLKSSLLVNSLHCLFSLLTNFYDLMT